MYSKSYFDFRHTHTHMFISTYTHAYIHNTHTRIPIHRHIIFYASIFTCWFVENMPKNSSSYILCSKNSMFYNFGLNYSNFFSTSEFANFVQMLLISASVWSRFVCWLLPYLASSSRSGFGIRKLLRSPIFHFNKCFSFFQVFTRNPLFDPK